MPINTLSKKRKVMNVAFVLPYLAERFGGPVVVAKNMGAGLAALGHNVSYWATGEEKDRGGQLSSIDSAHVYDLVWPRTWYRSKGLAAGLSAWIASIDIIHINGFWAYPVYAASQVAKANDTPYVIRPAGCLEPWRLGHRTLKWFKKKAYFNLISKSIMRDAACLQAVSQQEAEHFRLVGYRGPITIVPNGVNCDEFSRGNGAEAEACWPDLKDRQVVLFMSRLSPEKGLDQLIPMWADLVKSINYKDALLVIAGPDNRGYKKEVEGIIDRCDVGSQVLITGMVRGGEKLALFRRADIFILPSYSENFGIVVAEALACGTPVITTTATPWKVLQDIDAGRWVSPRGPELGQALRELLDMSRWEREKMGRRGRIFIKENYAWDRILGKILTVYDCILSGQPVPLHPEPLADTVSPKEHS